MSLKYTEDEARVLGAFDARGIGLDMNPYSAKNPRLSNLRKVYEEAFNAELAKIPECDKLPTT